MRTRQKNLRETLRTPIRGGLEIKLRTTLLVVMVGALPAAAELPPDFDGDGWPDFAVGAPKARVDGVKDSGKVYVAYGSENGPFVPFDGRHTTLHAGLTFVPGDVTKGDVFGSALAWGNFDGDCYDDLVVGVPGADPRGVSEAGVVVVLYGGLEGPGSGGSTLLYRGAAGVSGTAKESAHFGSALSVGDLTGDDYDDLVVGVWNDDVDVDGEVYKGAGSIHVFYGGRGGLPQQNWVEDLGTTKWGPHLDSGNQFGRSVTVADFDCDGLDDIAAGEPYADASGLWNAGYVHVFADPDGDGNRWSRLTQKTPEENEYFGVAISGGYYDDSNDPSSARRCAELVAGAPLQNYDDGYLWEGVGGFTIFTWDMKGALDTHDYTLTAQRPFTRLGTDVLVGPGAGVVQLGAPGSPDGGMHVAFWKDLEGSSGTWGVHFFGKESTAKLGDALGSYRRFEENLYDLEVGEPVLSEAVVLVGAPHAAKYGGAVVYRPLSLDGKQAPPELWTPATWGEPFPYEYGRFGSAITRVRNPGGGSFLRSCR